MGLNTKRVKTRLVTTTDSPTVEDDVLLCTDAGGSFTITLPAVTACGGKRLWIKKTNSSSNVITLAGTIDGVTNTTIDTKNEMLELLCDRSQWNIVNRYIDTSWQSYTPTGSWVTNVTYSGFWRRVGDTMEVQVHLQLTGAPTIAALDINVPNSKSIDSTKLITQRVGYYPVLGRGVLFDDSATTPYTGLVVWDSTTTVSVSRHNAGAASLLNVLDGVDNTSPVTWANDDKISLEFKVPILGWK